MDCLRVLLDGGANPEDRDTNPSKCPRTNLPRATSEAPETPLRLDPKPESS